MENKQNSGAIFKNKYKTEGDYKPDYKGTVNIDGVNKEIALWVRTDKNGGEYFSVKISEPYQQPDQVPPPISEQGGTAATVTNQVDDLPF